MSTNFGKFEHKSSAQHLLRCPAIGRCSPSPTSCYCWLACNLELEEYLEFSSNNHLAKSLKAARVPDSFIIRGILLNSIGPMVENELYWRVWTALLLVLRVGTTHIGPRRMFQWNFSPISLFVIPVYSLNMWRMMYLSLRRCSDIRCNFFRRSQ